MANDVYTSIRYFLIFGRATGILPLCGLKHKSSNRLSFRRNSFATTTSIVLIVIFSLNCAMATLRVIRVGKGDIFTVFGTSLSPVFYGIAAIKYAIFLRNSGKLIDIFKMWQNVSLNIPSDDCFLARNVNRLTGIMTVCNAIVNILMNLKYFGIEESKEFQASAVNTTGLEMFYLRSHKFWADLVPFNSVFAVYLFIQREVCIYSWYFSDTLIIVMAKLLNFKLKDYLEKLNRIFENGGKKSQNGKQQQAAEKSLDWERICDDYVRLAELAGSCRDFLSPLVFTSYGGNMFFVCYQIWAFRTEDDFSSLSDAVITVWPVFINFVRVVVINYEGARIHDYGQSLGKLIFQKVPLAFFPLKTWKIEKILEMNELGLTGLGCFKITYTLLLRLLLAIFTVEILLLQGQLTA